MIAIDTNVLLRYLLEDDVVQFAKASKLIEGSEAVLITDVVLVETIWTLKGAKYQLDKPELVEVIRRLFQEPNLRFEDGQVTWLALDQYRKSNGVDFADALIVNKAKSTANRLGSVFKGSYTFDKAAQKLPGAKAPR
ncbi:type II toxin-antitoxin system VapC family toxin [Spongiibacter sp. KMU-158]|uniref:Type II toxin-antitoxin system VapC family toxin n=1 Tax=Spongiibacter pelagi TaxID=2760804 RepID=A0A927C4G7_9GAMM|nr:type II toxin-antitoxin system VapC family toxin [Spongiibacter pelagi]MBD2859421.1 type II toxin-antitoxin system VapC family toxin [Spongiibacter pelagi]